ncbi:hypothetical protein U5N54_03450 [Bacillus paralicheniformis]|uniref:hypothetical protein n=1 Tax=Bacillus paralicheniformis TaxID=1648923 RepID=UPI00397BE7E7
MAKLTGVKTLDMVNGEITKVSYDGAEYVKTESPVQEGDLFLLTEGHMVIGGESGEFYLTEKHQTGAIFIPTRFLGSATVTQRNGDGIAFRKVSASQPSLEYRVSTNEKDIAALKSDVAALKGEAKPEYVRIDKSEAKAGDFVKFDEAPFEYLTAGKFYRIYRVDGCGDPRIQDDEGDDFDTYGRAFEVYRKVSDAEPKPERLKVGDYAKVVNATQSCMAGFSNGDIVEIIENSYGEDDCDFRIKSVAGIKYGYTKKTPDYIVRATDEEVAEAKDAAARAEFKKGAKVRLKSGGGVYPLHGFKDGGIYSVYAKESDREDGKNIVLEFLNGYGCGYATPDQLELLPEEEVAEIEKWAAIGREVGEYKAGDMVQYLYDGEICEVVDVAEDGSVKVATQNHGNCTENRSSIELIAPVEARFDRKGDE